MSIESRSRRYGKVFDHWQIQEFLGSGSGGKTAVFRLVRSDSDRGVSALKVINLIEVRGDVNNLSEFRRKEYETARDECSRNAEQEVWLMDALRGNTNIVDYLDHTFVDWSDETGFGRDLLIRMELLKDLRSEIRSGRIFTEREVLKIGRNICVALIRCHRKNILHRDVKPENIFCNNDGDYKLGDFGVSRVLDACPGAVASTGIGTYEYWPAEQMTGRYDKRVDIYSLGLVLYELSNRNRLPFAASTYVTGKEVSLRLTGTPLPEPVDASAALSEVILKACAFDPDERYQSAEEFLRALNRVVQIAQDPDKHRFIEKKRSSDMHAALPAEAPGTRSGEYATMIATGDMRKEQRSATTESAERKPFAGETAEDTDSRKTANKKRMSVGRIAVAILGLCMIAILVDFVISKRERSDVKTEVVSQETASEERMETFVPFVPEETTIPTEAEITLPPTESILSTEPVEETVDLLSVEAAEEPKNRTSFKPGEVVTFGRFEQDNKAQNGAEKIAWIILHEQDGKLLLLSRYALDSRRYNDTYGTVTWEECTLRTWLNNTFLNKAFSEEEQEAILLTKTDNSAQEGNQEWNPQNMNPTEDHVFLLSYADTERYFKDHADRICEPTPFAVAMGAELKIMEDGFTDTVWWWLRSPGEDNTQAAMVIFDGTRYTYAVGNNGMTVRPALWVDAEKLGNVTPKSYSGIITNTEEGVNIRAEPKVASDQLGKYLSGTVVEILETTTINGKQWCRTEHGWISMDYIDLEEVYDAREDTQTAAETAAAPDEEVVLALEKEDITIASGLSLQLKLKNNVDPLMVTWTAKDQDIVTVNEYGEIKAHKAGTSRIYVQYGDQKDSVIIRVIEK